MSAVASNQRRPILVFGRNGQVGRQLSRCLAAVAPVRPAGRDEADFLKPETIRSLIREVSPGLVVNAAAYTAVDRAEEEEELARAVNAIAPGIIGEEARRLDVPLVHFSTDYVFGDAPRPGGPDEGPLPWHESDPPSPINAYGRTKLEGERAVETAGCDHLILRTSWVYSTRGRNFLLTIKKLAGERAELRIVDDQTGCPTWANGIAEATGHIVRQCYTEGADTAALPAGTGGVYHLSAAGSTSWYGFAREIVEVLYKDRVAEKPRVVAIATRDYPLPAKRPKYSVLDNTLLAQTFGVSMSDWRVQLNLCLSA